MYLYVYVYEKGVAWHLCEFIIHKIRCSNQRHKTAKLLHGHQWAHKVHPAITTHLSSLHTTNSSIKAHLCCTRELCSSLSHTCTHTLHSPVSKGKMGIKKATMEMAFVHPWQKDPSPSASREHSYSIYRRGRERVPCHWKFSIHQWTQMTSWYQDPEESMNNWKNQRGGSENEHHTSHLLELHSQLQIRAVSSMQSNLPSLLNQGFAHSSMKFFPPLLQCCFPYLPLNPSTHAKGRTAIKIGHDRFLQKRPIHFSPFGESYHDGQVYRIFFMSEEMKLSEWRKMETERSVRVLKTKPQSNSIWKGRVTRSRSQNTQ